MNPFHFKESPSCIAFFILSSTTCPPPCCGPIATLIATLALALSGITFADMFFKRRVRLCLRLGRVSAPAAAEEPLEQRELLCARLAEYDGVDSLEVRRVREVRDLEVVGAVGERWA